MTYDPWGSPVFDCSLAAPCSHARERQGSARCPRRCLRSPATAQERGFLPDAEPVWQRVPQLTSGQSQAVAALNQRTMRPTTARPKCCAATQGAPSPPTRRPTIWARLSTPRRPLRHVQLGRPPPSDTDGLFKRGEFERARAFFGEYGAAECEKSGIQTTFDFETKSSAAPAGLFMS
jgi:hypothetical protein